MRVYQLLKPLEEVDHQMRALQSRGQALLDREISGRSYHAALREHTAWREACETGFRQLFKEYALVSQELFPGRAGPESSNDHVNVFVFKMVLRDRLVKFDVLIRRLPDMIQWTPPPDPVVVAPPAQQQGQSSIPPEDPVYTLKVSREEAHVALTDLLERGKTLLDSTRTTSLEQVDKDHTLWRDRCYARFLNIFMDAKAVTKAVLPSNTVVTFFPPTEDETREDHVSYIKHGLTKLESIIQNLEFMAVAPEASSEKMPQQGEWMSGIKIFISHSAKDKLFAKLVVDLLNGCFKVPDETIRCTSLDGYGLDAGDDSGQELRDNIASCDVLIALLTPQALTSSFVLMELGAAWVGKKRLCPVLAPHLTWDVLPGPTGPLHAIKANDSGGIQRLLNAVHKATTFERRPQAVSAAAVDHFLKELGNVVWESPATSTSPKPQASSQRPPTRAECREIHERLLSPKLNCDWELAPGFMQTASDSDASPLRLFVLAETNWGYPRRPEGEELRQARNWVFQEVGEHLCREGLVEPLLHPEGPFATSYEITERGEAFLEWYEFYTAY